MKTSASLFVVLLLTASANAGSVESIVRDALARELPADLGVVAVHVPRTLASLDVDPADAEVRVHGTLKAGRPSVKLVLPGKRPTYVPVTLAPVFAVAVLQRAVPRGATITAADVMIEMRPDAGAQPDIVVGSRTTRALTSGAIVGGDDIARPAPLARGTEVPIEVRRGTLRVRGTAKLELAARVGDRVSARLAATSHVVKGTLVEGPLLIVGDAP